MRPLFVTTFAMLSLATAGPAARAATPSPCDEARRLVGDSAGELQDEECLRLVEAAEEERWQLWLDMALAHEHSGDALAALPYYQRFLDAAAARQKPLAGAWASVQKDAVAAVARLDAELRATYGRVEVKTTPADAMASFEGKAASGSASHVTPFVQYLPPGTHTVELYHPDFSETVAHTFTLAKGQVLEVSLDLAAELARAKAAKAAVSSQAAVTPVAPGPKPVAEPPAPDGGDSTLATLGWLGVAAGVGLVAAGTVFGLEGAGLVDEAKCSTEAWCAATVDERARRKDDGEALQDRGLAAWIAGGVLLFTGVAAVILADGDDADDATQTSGWQLEAITPALGRDGGAGIGAAWSF